MRASGRSGCRWEDPVEVDLQEIGCEDVGWVQLS
jgi:hypothetical protein